MNPKSQIFIKSPQLNIPTQTLIFENPNPTPNSILQHLKKSFNSLPIQIPFNSIFLTLNGKPLFQNPQIPNFSTLTLTLKCLGGGGDGGSTCAESRDCFLNMYAVKKPDKADPNEVKLSKWVNCSLSNEPLKHPVVIDKLGNLFNKVALVEGLLKKSLPKVFGYIKGLKDMIPVELAEIPGRKGDGDVKFQCPITGFEFNGNYKFYALRGCGHVLSAKGLKEVRLSECLVCRKEFVEGDKIVINGSEEEVNELWEKMKVEVHGGKENGKKSKKVRNVGDGEKVVGRVSGTKRGSEGNGVKGGSNGTSKKVKGVVDDVGGGMENAKSAVYKSIFTSSRKSDFKETYSCRSLPLGRN